VNGLEAPQGKPPHWLASARGRYIMSNNTPLEFVLTHRTRAHVTQWLRRDRIQPPAVATNTFRLRDESLPLRLGRVSQLYFIPMRQLTASLIGSKTFVAQCHP